MSLCERTHPGKDLSESLEGTDDPPAPEAAKGAEPRWSRALDPRPQEQLCFPPASVSPILDRKGLLVPRWAPNNNPRECVPGPGKGKHMPGCLEDAGSGGTHIQNIHRSPTPMGVEDELPGRAAPGTSPATGRCSFGAQNTWHPWEQRKHLTLLDQHQQSDVQSRGQELSKPLSIRDALASFKVRRGKPLVLPPLKPPCPERGAHSKLSLLF